MRFKESENSLVLDLRRDNDMGSDARAQSHCGVGGSRVNHRAIVLSKIDGILLGIETITFKHLRGKRREMEALEPSQCISLVSEERSFDFIVKQKADLVSLFIVT